MQIKINRHRIFRMSLMLFVQIAFSATLWAQNITLDYNNVPLKFLMEQISKQTPYKFAYTNEVPLEKQTASISCKDADIRQALEAVFSPTGIQYRIEGNQIVLSLKPAQPAGKDQAQMHHTISGFVKDNSGEPLPGVYVTIENTDKVTVTDAMGRYEISCKEGDRLRFSLMGMVDGIAAVGKSSHINIVLKEDTVLLEDVVVTGYQTISKERSAGSYAVITSEKIGTKLNTNIMDRLEGMVSGMQMYRGKPVIRGTSTIFADKSPLYVVDGVPFEGDIDMINPNDIVNVSVLKDATAASIYGARSTNGVIVITTRSGRTGKIHVNYNGTVSMQMLPDRDYTNLMSSREFVDFQQDIFNEWGKKNVGPRRGEAVNEVYRLLFEHRDGNISSQELNAGLDKYRNLDRYDQTRDQLHKVSLTHQHNLSFNGGSDFYKYNFSVNYTGSSPYEKKQYRDRLGFNVKNNFKIAKWFDLDIGILGNVINDKYDDGISFYNELPGIGSSNFASYYMLADAQGNPLNWERKKNMEEVERLKGLGLLDETYYPLLEKDKGQHTVQSHYFAVNLGARFNILKSLNIEFRYQTELGSEYIKDYDLKDAFKVKTMINDATVVDSNGRITQYVPNGGQVFETYRKTNAYTLRAQINYSETFSQKHDFTVLAGAERRKVTADGNEVKRFGYDDYNLSYKPLLDENELYGNGIYGTQSLNGMFGLENPARMTAVDDRYISFYANASYIYNQRLGLSASIRMDQSNLFGTDPKYQYKPLWSAGANYQIFKPGQKRWINRLTARATYGINGNVYRQSGPYIISKVASYASPAGEKYASIVSPPNPSLRWEKTKTLNLGVDFSFLRDRLGGSIEFYNKRTNDLIGDRGTDPILGWRQLRMNYATMRNSGVEISLNSLNINSRNFKWETNAFFSYNSNKIVHLESSGAEAYTYYYEPQAVEGKPFNAIYSTRYAGLNEEGVPQFYMKDGSISHYVDDLSVEDLVYSGTYDPPYAASMTNTLSFKGFELSFMFVYYGGHVMRDDACSMYLSSNRPFSYNVNLDRRLLDRWKEPGDEADLHRFPAFYPGASYNYTETWGSADIHVQKGDYIRLRDLSLAYNFPQKWMSKLKIQDMKLTFQAQNLWMWAANDSKLDPEVWNGSNINASRGMKIPSSFIFGLNINF